MSKLICPVFPVSFGASRLGIHSLITGLIKRVEISKPLQMWVDEADHFGTSMAEINIEGIKHWPIPSWLLTRRWPFPVWQRTNDVTTLAKSVRLALTVKVGDGWVPKLDSDYVKEVL